MNTLPLEKLISSPTQPRVHFRPEAMQVLVNSMRAHGFTLSTILVRRATSQHWVDSITEGQHFLMQRDASGEKCLELLPTPELAQKALEKVSGLYEIVDGERRVRSAREAGLKEAPVNVRELTDAQVLEQQLTAGGSGEPLTDLEEAEGLRRALELRDAASGQPVHTRTTLAAKIGRSVSHVDLRLKLCALDGEERKAVEENMLPIRTAMLIAGIPDRKLRERFAKEVLHPKTEEAPLSFRKAENLRREKYMRDLRGAPFDLADATLVPVHVNQALERDFGGACSDCPFRLGNTPDAAEIPNAQHNLCLLPSCYEAKRSAGWKAWQEQETDSTRKRRALTEAECEQLYQHGDQLNWNSGKVDLSERPDSSDLRPGEETSETWKRLAKGADLEVLVARDKNGRKHELVNRELAIAAAVSNGHAKLFKKQVGEKPGKAANDEHAHMSREATEETRRRQEADAAQQREEEEFEARMTQAIAAEIGVCAVRPDRGSANYLAIRDGIWAHIMAALRVDYFHEADLLIATARGWKASNFDAQFAALEPDDQFAVIAQWLWLGSDDLRIETKSLLKLFGVDRKVIEKSLKAHESGEPLATAGAICSRTGCKRPAADGYKMCDHCREKVRENQKQKRVEGRA